MDNCIYKDMTAKRYHKKEVHREGSHHRKCVTQNRLHFFANLDCFKAFLVLFQFNLSLKDAVSRKMPQQRANLGRIWVWKSKEHIKLQANWTNCSSLSVWPPPCWSVHLLGTGEVGGRRSAVTYRLICGGRRGQLRGLPSSYWVWEVVVGSDLSIKLVLGRNNSYIPSEY